MLDSPLAHNAFVRVPHVIKGRPQTDVSVEHRSRTGEVTLTPPINLDDLIWRRNELPPAFDTPLAEIVDFLAAVGKALDFDKNLYLQDAVARMGHVSTLGPRILENCYRDLASFFEAEAVWAEAEGAIGDTSVLDGWRPSIVRGANISIRAFPPRLVHILAGNAPVVPPITIVRGAITKGVHLLKMPSNDMFTATAILRTMADVGPNHPVTKSFSAAYWKGGDAAIESAIFRSQYYDKLIVWGGEAAVRHAMKYVAPGFEIISFDPKVSISLIGREAFVGGISLHEIASRAAADVVAFNQDACSSARFQFVEGSVQQVDQYCEALVGAMGQHTRYGDGAGGPVPPAAILEDLGMLSMLEPEYRVFGEANGNGMVIRSSEPVSFSPSGKLVNVVHVENLADAVAYVTVATQSVGIYPEPRIAALRDRLANAGVQRIVPLGAVHGGQFGGLPHDNNLPVHRFMRWIVDQNGDA